ncbi:hypothetical protein Patl1_22011 [Pistacia atlantica]|uniref:Uncharacterized protein n=1 Tax=Pistacia atlantica TaxID=434234 RepID=A0ACC1BH94_9ROSI|nr:hypothetical protein Patl1_22011 [Pistacia atlantica]
MSTRSPLVKWTLLLLFVTPFCPPSVSPLAPTIDDDVATFFQASASMAGTPERVGGLLCERVKHPRKWLMRAALWFLSTSIGSLILCGRFCLSTNFPFIHSFPQLSQHQREAILLSWSLSYFHLLRTLYKAIKIFILFVFFTQVDEKNENLSWKAIGYSGPDPTFKKQTKQTRKWKQSEGEREEEEEIEENVDEQVLYGPLYKGLISMQLPVDRVANSLREVGFPVSIGDKKVDAASSISNPSLVVKCDAVVVGSGSGGGVIAGVLATAGYKVLVLEKGNYCARTNLSLLEGPTLDQMYLNGGLLVTEDAGMVLLAGSTVGGGSTVNWSASIQTPQHVVNEWSDQLELELFESKLYRDAIDVVCEKMAVQLETVEEGFNNAVLRRGCEELGYPVENVPRNAPPDHYCGWCCFGCKDGKKKGTSETWLVDLVNSGKSAILPGCEAIKVLHKRKKGRDRDRATGVAFEFEYNGVKDICIDTPSNGWPEKEKKSYEGGIITTMSSVVANFDKLGYGALIQTPSLHPGMFSKSVAMDFGDKGSGIVNSPNSISYQIDAADEENLQKGLEKMLRTLAAAGAEEIGTHHPKGKKLNVKQLIKWGVAGWEMIQKHQAVNQMGETWEVEGLYVADTSVFPTALGVNPMITVQAIAYCTAQSVLEVLRRKRVGID